MQVKLKDSFFIKDKTKYNFHVSGKCREKYGFEENLFSITGDLIISNFPSARFLSNQINETRKKEKGHPAELIVSWAARA